MSELERLRTENADLRQRLECVTLDRNVLDLGCDELATQLAAAQAREQSVLKTAGIVDSNLCAAIDDESAGADTLLGAMLNAHVDLAMLQRDQPDHAALDAVLEEVRHKTMVRAYTAVIELPWPARDGTYIMGFCDGVAETRRAIRALPLEEEQ